MSSGYKLKRMIPSNNAKQFNESNNIMEKQRSFVRVYESINNNKNTKH